MTWLAIANSSTGYFDPQGLDGGAPVNCDRSQGHALLPRGSLVIETRLSPEGRPQNLLSLRRTHPWVGQISLQAIPGDGIALVLAQGSDVFHKVLKHDAEARTDVLRITYSWDAPAKWGRLALERPESDRLVLADTPPPPPFMLEDIRVLVQRPQLREMDRDMLFFAISDQIEPLGPNPKLTLDVPVETAQGYRPVSALQRGDLVRSRSGELVPVLERVTRLVPGMGSFQPVRLRAPYFGLEQDIIVGPEQRLVIGGSEVEYLFGQEAALVPARHLVNNVAAVHETGHPLVHYTQVILPGHEALKCAGTALESLYLGRLRRKKEMLAASILADFPRNLLPEHPHPIFPVLKPFEAITLAENRAA